MRSVGRAWWLSQELLGSNIHLAQISIEYSNTNTKTYMYTYQLYQLYIPIKVGAQTSWVSLSLCLCQITKLTLLSTCLPGLCQSLFLFQFILWLFVKFLCPLCFSFPISQGPLASDYDSQAAFLESRHGASHASQEVVNHHWWWWWLWRT